MGKSEMKITAIQLCSSELLFKMTHIKRGRRQSSYKRLNQLLSLSRFFVNLCGCFVEDMRNFHLPFPTPFSG
jgi:hypothetical protein